MGDLEREIEIFRAGKHTASNGMKVDLSAADLQQVVETYDPANFNAPVVLGHPKHNDPAWGQVKGLKMVGDRLKAVVHRLAPEFVEWVRDGRYHSISPSFYLPDSSANPYPGKLSLRHIGFLGAVPPAVKGMAAPEFQEVVDFFEDEDGVIAFMCDACSLSSSTPPLIATLFSKFRDWLIDEYDLQTADGIISPYELDALRSLSMYPGHLEGAIDDLRKQVYMLQEQAASVNSPRLLNYEEAKPMNSTLKKLMKQKGVTPAAAADATGLDQARIDAFLSGDEEPSESDLEAIAEVLGVPKSMLGGKKKEATADMSEEYEQLKAENEVLQQRAVEAELRARKVEIQNFCEGLVRRGTLTAAQLTPRTIDFGEGESHELGLVDFMASLEPYQLEFFKSHLSAAKPALYFGEIAGDDVTTSRSTGDGPALPPGYDADPQASELASQISSFAEEHGISFNEAYQRMSQSGALV